MLGDQQQNARIVEAVAGLGTSAVAIAVCRWAVATTTWKVKRVLITRLILLRAKTLRLLILRKYRLTRRSIIRVKADAADLISQLQSAGATYSIDLDGDGTPDVSGGDGELDTDLSCTPTFDGPPC